MAIKSVNKRGKIGKKLILSYMLVLIIAFLVVGITFKVVLTNYLLSETKKELSLESKKLARRLSRIYLQREKIQELLLNSRTLRIWGHHIDAKIAILDGEGRVINTNFYKDDKKILSMIQNSEKLQKKGYVVVKVPINENDKRMGEVVLLTRVKELKGLNRIGLRMLLISFLVAAALALIVSLFLERSLVKPIMKLRDKINNFSIKEFNEINLKTNDEIEELANSFNIMADKLKSYDERQIRFLQNASHELKTPLMSIQGYAEGIKDGVIEGEELYESLDIIIDESQRLKRLVEQIIYLTQLENVEEVFQFQKVYISEIVESSIKSVNSLAMDRGIEIKFEFEENRLGAYDVEKMKRVFINLIGNAIRYAKKSILVLVKNEGEDIIIEIIDDGQGFKSGEDKRIFERFYKGNEGGSGIGLAITEAIVKGHGGTICAYNHESLGAVFRINLIEKEERL